MVENDSVCMPKLTLLNETRKERIHQAALKILNDIGMKIMHDAALRILRDAGCRIRENGIATIPIQLVQQAIESAPGNIAVYDRNGGHRMDVGERRTYFGTGSDLIYAFDAVTGTRRMCTLDDVGRAALVADALPNIDFIGANGVRFRRGYSEVPSCIPARHVIMSGQSPDEVGISNICVFTST